MAGMHAGPAIPMADTFQVKPSPLSGHSCLGRLAQQARLRLGPVKQWQWQLLSVLVESVFNLY